MRGVGLCNHSCALTASCGIFCSPTACWAGAACGECSQRCVQLCEGKGGMWVGGWMEGWMDRWMDREVWRDGERWLAA